MDLWYIADFAAAQLRHLHHSCSVWSRSAVQKGSERDALWSSVSPSPPWGWAFPAPTESARMLAVSRVCAIPVLAHSHSPDLTKMFLLELLSFQSLLLLVFSWPPPSLWAYSVKKGVKKSQKDAHVPAGGHAWCAFETDRDGLAARHEKKKTQKMEDWTQMEDKVEETNRKVWARMTRPISSLMSGFWRGSKTKRDRSVQCRTDRQTDNSLKSVPVFCPSLWPWSSVTLTTGGGACKMMQQWQKQKQTLAEWIGN